MKLRLISLALSLLASPLARAADDWSNPYTGIWQLHRTESGPLDIYVLMVDLCEHGISLRATAEDERRDQVSDFGAAVGAEAAINGDFFSYTDYYPIGMAVSSGDLWHADNSTLGFIAFGGDHAQIRPESEVWSTPASWMSEAVGGYPVLVTDGVAGTSFSAPDHCPSRHPRSAVGLSRDRQTLYLAVVDGRTSASIGMTCPELAVLMRDLGAYTALNLDGGGSSTLWTASGGVLNNPSDGSERTVSNHLGVFATASGAPTSCDFWQDEVILNASVLDSSSSDVNGDGHADLCARSSTGFSCQLSDSLGGSSGSWAIPDLSDKNGWNEEDNYGTIRMADINGDGRADLCARDADRVHCWPAGEEGFEDALDGPTLSDASGWSDIKYWSTLRFVDVDGDGDQDACARASAGVQCWPSTGSSFDTPFSSGRFDDAGGWGHPDHYGTIRMADIDGDLRADLCARGHAGMWCYLGDGAGFPTSVPAPTWSDDAGWDDVDYWSTIRLLDLDGDGRADLCGRGPAGEECYLSEGKAFSTTAITIPDLADSSGWSDHDNYATQRFGDVDGDGDQDLCVRGTAGVWCHLYEAGAFKERMDGPLLSDATGWTDFRYYSTLRLADLDANGTADLCARASDGMHCYLSDGEGFPVEAELIAWSDASGWDREEYFSTIRAAGGRLVSSPDSEDTEDTGPGDDTDDHPDDDTEDSPDSHDSGGFDFDARHPQQKNTCGCASSRDPKGASAIGLLAVTLVLCRKRRTLSSCVRGSGASSAARCP